MTVEMIFRTLAVGATMAAMIAASADAVAPQVPPFPTRNPLRWIGTPVTWEELRGRVVLVDVWTFG